MTFYESGLRFYEDFERYLVVEGDILKCHEIFYDVLNIQFINDYADDISSLFIDNLFGADWSSTNMKLDADRSQFCADASLYLCQLFGNPKDLFLFYLEKSAQFMNAGDLKFELFVDILHHLLMRLPQKLLQSSLEMALCELQKYVKQIDSESIQDAAVKTGSSSAINRLCRVTTKYIDFISSFASMNDKTLSNILTISSVNLMDKPLLDSFIQHSFDEKQQQSN
jgi:hypothetical protein